MGAEKCRSMCKKLQKWVKDVKCLSQIAVTQPQAAFATFTTSLQCEWNDLQQVLPDGGTMFADVEQTLAHRFWPAILEVK